MSDNSGARRLSADDQCRLAARVWGLKWSALQLTILREHGGEALAEFKFKILSRHQRSHFLEGVKRLGISLDLPPAVIAGRYHYLSNQIGSLKMEYIEESPRRVWIRYLAPNWSFPGTAICAVPGSVPRAMFAGWHPRNGLSLDCPRLGFVITKLIQEGEPYDEGYFEEFDRALEPDERLQFKPVLMSPDFDPAKAPMLDPAAWPDARKLKALRNFAIGYLEDAIHTLIESYGVSHAAALIGKAMRMCAAQFFDEIRHTCSIEGRQASDLVDTLVCLFSSAGDKIEVQQRGAAYLLYRTPRGFASNPVPNEIAYAMFEFPRMLACVQSARVKVSRAQEHGSKTEEWSVQDVAERLF
jgi:hypothetical protein